MKAYYIQIVKINGLDEEDDNAPIVSRLQGPIHVPLEPGVPVTRTFKQCLREHRGSGWRAAFRNLFRHLLEEMTHRITVVQLIEKDLDPLIGSTRVIKQERV